MAILYLCDRRACLNCSYPTCEYTTDIAHAKNFKRMPAGDFIEELVVPVHDYYAEGDLGDSKKGDAT